MASSGLDRDARLRRAVHHIMQADDFPALTRQLAEIIGGLGTGEHSAQRIATIVLRDYSLTLKVVRTANSAHYRRGERAIGSVTQAMMVLGVDAVRRLAAGLLFLEHYRRQGAGLRELLLLSLMTASHAREAAHRTGHPDPESAYLCGMVRNIGEVLVACHFPGEYARVLQDAARDVPRPDSQRPALPGSEVGGATRRASIRVLGFAFEDLGDAILEQWGMPADIRQAIRATGASSDTPLQQLTAYAHELTTAVYRMDHLPDATGLPSSAAAVHGRYGARLGLGRDALAALLASTVEETRGVFADVGVSLDELRLTRQAAAALADLGVDPDIFPALATAMAGVQADRMRVEIEAARHAALLESRERLHADLVAAAAPDAGHELHTILVMALEACLRGGPVDRATFCLLTPGGLLEARLTVGVQSDRLAGRFPLAMRELTTPIVRAIDQKQEAVIDGGPSAPAGVCTWLRSVGAEAAVILPLLVNGAGAGALYLDLLVSGPGITPARGMPRVCEGGSPARDPALDERAVAFFTRVRTVALGAMAARSGTAAAPAGARSPAPPTAGAAGLATAEARRDLVLRLLRGEAPAHVAADARVCVHELERWRADFLAGAVAALAPTPGS